MEKRRRRSFTDDHAPPASARACGHHEIRNDTSSQLSHRNDVTVTKFLHDLSGIDPGQVNAEEAPARSQGEIDMRLVLSKLSTYSCWHQDRLGAPGYEDDFYSRLYFVCFVASTIGTCPSR